MASGRAEPLFEQVPPARPVRSRGVRPRVRGVARIFGTAAFLTEPADRARPRPDAERLGANARGLADTEYLARELAAIRLSLGEMPTRDDLDERLEHFGDDLDGLRTLAGAPGVVAAKGA